VNLKFHLIGPGTRDLPACSLVPWSLTLREGHRLGVLRRIFGPRRDELTGKWRKLHNEELHDFFSSPSNIRIVRRKG
jgi:hypothetical protein